MEREKAIEVIKEAMPTLWKETKEAIQTLIPELAENEDERMMRKIIEGFKNFSIDFTKWNNIPVEEIITYLEKKKEQKPAEQIEDNEEKSIGTTLINALNGNARLEWELKRAGVNVQKLITYFKQNPAKWSEEDGVKIGTLSSIIFDYAFYKDALDENNDLTGEYAELEDWLESLPERFNLQPKVEWSEEDNRILYNVISYIGFAAGQRGVKNNLFKEANDWIKSLPERFELSSKQEWNENDEAAFGDLMWCIEQARKSAKDENDMGNIWFAENWIKTRLKSLRPQSKQKWSEEDRKMLNTIISDGSRGVELDAKQVNFLKSLCPQYRWKPSKEQMEALNKTAFGLIGTGTEIDVHLASLYEDLKKL